MNSSGKVIRGPVPDHYLRLMSKADRALLGKGGQLPEEIKLKYDRTYERKLQDQINSLLLRNGIVPNSSRMDRRKTDRVGWPDHTFCIHGQACLIEAKSPDADLTKEQAELKPQLEANGWRYFIVRTYEQALAVVRSLGIKL